MSRERVWRVLLLIVCFGIAGYSAAAASEPTRTIRLQGLPEDQVPVITSIAIQPNGSLLASAGDDHLVRIWDVHSGRLVRTLNGHKDWVTSVTFCSDGAELLTGSRDRRVLIWDVQSGRLRGELGRHDHPISAVEVSPIGDLVAVIGFRAPLRIFDLATAKELANLTCPCADMRAVAFSENLNYVAGGGRNGRVRLWNLATGEQRDLLAHRRRVRALVFTPDSQQLLSSSEDQTIRIWDVAMGTTTHTIAGESGKVLSMAMLGPNSLATASSDNVIRLFQLDQKQPFARLEGHTGSIAALATRNQTLISGSFDTTVKIWAIPGATARTDGLPGRVIPTAVTH